MKRIKKFSAYKLQEIADYCNDILLELSDEGYQADCIPVPQENRITVRIRRNQEFDIEDIKPSIVSIRMYLKKNKFTSVQLEDIFFDDYEYMQRERHLGVRKSETSNGGNIWNFTTHCYPID